MKRTATDDLPVDTKKSAADGDDGVTAVVRDTSAGAGAGAGGAGGTGTVTDSVSGTAPESGPDQAARAAGAIVASLVADAACMPSHWMYDTDKIAARVAENPAPAFHPEPADEFYKYPFGALTPYGNEMLALLRSLAEKGDLDVSHYTTTFASFARGHDGYLNQVSKELLAKLDAGAKPGEHGGADVDHSHLFYTVIAVTALYAGKANFQEKLKAAVGVLQDNKSATTSAVAAGVILEHVLTTGCSVAEGLKFACQPGSISDFAISRRLRFILESSSEVSTPVLTRALGDWGSNPEALFAALHAAKLHPSLEEAVNAVISAGGDQAGRAAFIAALYGASGGVEVIPKEWTSKCLGWLEEVRTLADTIGKSATDSK